MRANLNITITIDNESEGELRESIERIMQEKKYESVKEENRIYYYACIEQTDPQYNELLRIIEEITRREKSGEKTGITFLYEEFETQYEEDELKRAVGYEIKWGGGDYWMQAACMEEKYGWCDSCHEELETEDIILKKTRIWSRNRMKKCLAMDYDDSYFYVTVPLYEYLLEHGISSDNFAPVYFGSKKRMLAGYKLKAANTLPQGAYVAESIPKQVCRECGKIRVRLRITKYFVGQYLDMQKVEKVEDVNETYEYFQGKSRQIIISTRLKDLLAEADSELKVEPVFPLSMKAELETLPEEEINCW